jgi:hypothetical protein
MDPSRAFLFPGKELKPGDHRRIPMNEKISFQKILSSLLNIYEKLDPNERIEFNRRIDQICEEFLSEGGLEGQGG